MEQWAQPASQALSFFKGPAANAASSSSKEHAGPHIYFLPYTAVFHVLRFLPIRDVAGNCARISRGWAELVQSIRYDAWAQRLLEAVIPRRMFAQMESRTTIDDADRGGGGDEMLLLHSRGVSELHRLMCATATSEAPPPAVPTAERDLPRIQRLFALLQYFEDEAEPPHASAQSPTFQQSFKRNKSCRVCHLIDRGAFFAKRRQGELEAGSACELDVAEWSRCYSEIRSYLLRGDSDVPETTTTSPPAASNPSAPAATAAAAAAPKHGAAETGGLLTKFTWRHLLQRDARHFAAVQREMARQRDLATANAAEMAVVVHESRRQAYYAGHEHENVVDVDGTDGFVVVVGCKKCQGRGCTPSKTACPAVNILGHIGAAALCNPEPLPGSGGNNNNPAMPPWGFPRKPPPQSAELAALLSHRATEATSSLQVEAEYFGLLVASIPTSVRTYYFPNELKRAVTARVTNPLTLRSVELRWFQSSNPNTGRYLCELIVWTKETRRDNIGTYFDQTNGEAPDLLRLLLAGYGRVETDKPPFVKCNALTQAAAALELSPQFPLSLLWNVIVMACGAGIDLLAQVQSLRVHHHLELSNFFEEMAVWEDKK